jgi:hypothetical protein
MKRIKTQIALVLYFRDAFRHLSESRSRLPILHLRPIICMRGHMQTNCKRIGYQTQKVQRAQELKDIMSIEKLYTLLLEARYISTSKFCLRVMWFDVYSEVILRLSHSSYNIRCI